MPPAVEVGDALRGERDRAVDRGGREIAQQPLRLTDGGEQAGDRGAQVGVEVADRREVRRRGGGQGIPARPPSTSSRYARGAALQTSRSRCELHYRFMRQLRHRVERTDPSALCRYALDFLRASLALFCAIRTPRPSQLTLLAGSYRRSPRSASCSTSSADVPPTRVSSVRPEITIASLDVENSEGEPLINQIPDEENTGFTEDQALEEVERLERQLALRRVADQVLTDRDRAIVFRIQRGETRVDIKDDVGVTAQRVGQIYTEALERLRAGLSNDPSLRPITNHPIEGGNPDDE